MKRVCLGEFMLYVGTVILAVLASPLLLLGHINQVLLIVVLALVGASSLMIAGAMYPFFYNDDETAKSWWYRHLQRD